jgi:hypothetical protein
MSAKPFRAAGLSGKFSGSGMGGVYEAAELSRFGHSSSSRKTFPEIHKRGNVVTERHTASVLEYRNIFKIFDIGNNTND